MITALLIAAWIAFLVFIVRACMYLFGEDESELERSMRKEAEKKERNE